MRDDKRRGQNFETEDTIDGCALQLFSRQRVFATFFQRAVNLFENFDQVRARAAARIEHVNIRVRTLDLFSLDPS